MQTVQSGNCTLHVKVDGPADGPVVMFADSLGTDMRVWDPLLPHLPSGLRIVRFDKRGHGLSDAPAAPYTIDELVADAAAVADAVGVANVTFVGLSIGGLIGQGLAISRPDLVARLVLMDTAAKIGSNEMWSTRIAAVRDGGLAGMVDAILERWFAPGFLNDAQAMAPWRNMLSRTPAQGYIGCCHAIAGADFIPQARSVTIPMMTMAGDHDQSTPPALVKETAALYGASFHEIADAGHLPCVEKPAKVAALITSFLKEQTDV